MMQNTIFQYVLNLFGGSRDGVLTVGDADNRFDYCVEWDEGTAKELAQRCSALLAHLTELAGQYDKLLTGTQHLTKEQMEVWSTYLQPFPKHGLDMEALQSVWEKLEMGEPVTEEEQALSDQYTCWYENNALLRLPAKRCAPTQLINRVQRYGKLVRLNAPTIVLENEAKRFTEEFVLYHCMHGAKCSKII